MPRSRRAGPDRRFGAVLSLYLFGLAGCDGERLTVHPLPELLIRPGAPAAVIESSAGAVPPAAAFVVELREGDNTISIGVLDEPSPLQFGSVAGAEFGPGGTLLVLDGQASDLRVFSLGAGPPEVIAAGVQIVGGAGTGPGEFQRPTALSVGRAGLLGVFESTGRVHLFGWNEEGALEHRTTFQLRMDVEDGCVLGDHLVTTGLHSEHSGAVHLFSTSGEWVRSFGRFYDTDNPWVSRDDSPVPGHMPGRLERDSGCAIVSSRGEKIRRARQSPVVDGVRRVAASILGGDRRWHGGGRDPRRRVPWNDWCHGRCRRRSSDSSGRSCHPRAPRKG